MTYKQVAEFILAQTEEIQNMEAGFVNLNSEEGVTLDGDNLRFIHLIEKDALTQEYIEDYTALANSQWEIDPEYIHYID